MKSQFVEKIQQFIALHQLLDKRALHLVALSGGADSVAMLRALIALGFRVEAVHCNFTLRGDESERDQQFCESLCENLHIPLHIQRFDTRKYAQENGISIEMAARQLRYDFFEQTRQSRNAATICVAHHAEDSVETILMNLLRGTGIQGLTGISPINGFVRRPMLNVTRSDLEDYLKELNQNFIVDSTNLEDCTIRNVIRNRVLPIIEKQIPNAQENILQTAKWLKESQKILDEKIEEELAETRQSNRLSLEKLQQSASPETLLYAWLAPMGFSSQTIAQIAEKNDYHTGATWQSDEKILLVNREFLEVHDRETCAFQPIVVETLDQFELPENGCITFDEVMIDDAFEIDKVSWLATLDYDKVSFPLTIRTTRAGDRFQPFGMRGTKLVSDYLTDRKRSLIEKQSQLVLTDAQDRILWVIEERIDQRFCITSESKKALLVRVDRPTLPL